MPEPAPPAPIERRLHTSQLAGFIARAQQTLARHELPPDQIAAFLGSSVATTCAGCGGAISGDELLQLAAPADAAAPRNPRLERLRQGYCAGGGCNSYFLNVSLHSSPELDWSKVLAEMDAGTPMAEAESAAAKARAAWPRRQKLARIAIGVALVLVTLLIRQLVLHRPIPFIYEPKHFAVDPASVPRQTRQ